MFHRLLDARFSHVAKRLSRLKRQCQPVNLIRRSSQGEMEGHSLVLSGGTRRRWGFGVVPFTSRGLVVDQRGPVRRSVAGLRGQ